MGTETLYPVHYLVLHHIHNHVKLNNPLMGTETNVYSRFTYRVINFS